MRKDTNILNSASRRAYVRPFITAVVPVSLELLVATPTPEVHVEPEPGYEALSKESDFDMWQEDEEEETPTKPFKFDWRKISTQ